MLRLIKTETVALPVKLRLPTATAGVFNEGSITAQVVVLSKDQLKDLADAETSDADYIKTIVKDVEGLGDAQGNPIKGEAALAEVLNGDWSSFLQNAILAAYFEQFGEARVKNSKTSRGR